MKIAKILFLFLMAAPLVAAQQPPVVRQSLTTNTASNPSAAGQLPIWSGTSWLPGTNVPSLVITNLYDGNGDVVVNGATAGAIGDVQYSSDGAGGHGAEAAMNWNAGDDQLSISGTLLMNTPAIILLGPGGLTQIRSNFVTIDGPLTAAGITNSAGYNHPTGAAAGEVFIVDADGNATWDTNVTTLNVTNLTIVNNFTFKGSTTVSNINQDWTNDTVVLKTITPVPVRLGEIASSGTGAEYWNATNVGKFSLASGSNVLARGVGSVSFGLENTVKTNAHWSTIAGGQRNNIDTNVHSSFVGGGGLNRIVGLGAFNSVIAGGSNNLAQILPGTDLGGMFIGGGGDHQALSNYCVIVGGFANRTFGDYSFVGGGLNTTLNSSGTKAVVVGGEQHGLYGAHSFIGGGKQNQIGGTFATATAGNVIGGGHNNRIGSSGNMTNGVVAGGAGNELVANSDLSVIAGGRGNLVDQGTNCVISGGNGNIVTSAHLGVIAGGTVNLINTSGDWGFIAGHSNQVNANFAFAIGTKLTNTLASSLDVGFDNSTKTTFGASQMTMRSGLKLKRKFTGTNYTAVAADMIIHCTNTTAITITLTAAATMGDGAALIIKDAGGNAATQNITIDADGAETIDGATTQTLNANYQSLSLYSDGANWFIW